MANRNLRPLAGALEPKVVVLSKVVTFGSASISSQTGKGLSVARSSAGVYTITLEDKYNSLIGGQCMFEASSAVDLVPQLNSVDVSGAGTIGLKLLAAATATEPASGTKLYITLLLKNSSL